MTRRFNPDEVTFSLTARYDDMIEPDFDLGDEELNREIRDGIEKRLEYGDIWAWASVKVSASFGGLTGNAYLGGCNYEDEADFRANGHLKDMLEEALTDLLSEIKGAGWEVECTPEDIKKAVAKEAA